MHGNRVDKQKYWNRHLVLLTQLWRMQHIYKNWVLANILLHKKGIIESYNVGVYAMNSCLFMQISLRPILASMYQRRYFYLNVYKHKLYE